MPVTLRFLFCYCLLWLTCCHAAGARVRLSKYPVQVVVDSTINSRYAIAQVDSVMGATPMFNPKQVLYGIERPHIMQDKTMDFYLLVSLALLLGFLRYSDPKYFENLWRVFRNPSQGRAARDQLELSVIPNAVMNLFFVMVAGAYLFYVVGATTPITPRNISPGLLVLMLIAGIALIYFAKYLVVRFSGWAFKIESITEYYIFNIFLVNKIIAIALFPFVLLLAFANPVFAGPAVIVSVALIIFLFVNRYIRSWQVFGSFFQYSKFHFFTYLCASEILPLAVLIKLLVRGLLY